MLENGSYPLSGALTRTLSTRPLPAPSRLAFPGFTFCLPGAFTIPSGDDGGARSGRQP